MKLTLGFPYSEDWRAGYIITAKDGRKNVALVGFSGQRTTVAYARYVMACKLKKYVSEELQVDHIDNDKTNDAEENLQLLSKKENIQKYGRTIRVNVHGSLSTYRYCKCEKCKLGKSLYNKGDKTAYYSLLGR